MVSFHRSTWIQACTLEELRERGVQQVRGTRPVVAVFAHDGKVSAVDNRCYKRILYDILDHDPTHEDIRAFLGRLKTALEARDLPLWGITTDGSSLYPEPLAEIFAGVPHQICQFHIVADVVKAVLSAVASERKALAAKQPKLPKGRPSTKAAKAAARKKKRLEQKRADLYQHRHLLVQHDLSRRERKRLWRITRGLPQLRKLRELMDQVYALFDRRCRTQTALDVSDCVNRYQNSQHGNVAFFWHDICPSPPYGNYKPLKSCAIRRRRTRR